jgi:hypothetical protein
MIIKIVHGGSHQDAFDLKLAAVDAKAKIKIIKEVRTITGLGLKEAKELVEKAPVVIKEGLPKDEAAELLKTLSNSNIVDSSYRLTEPYGRIPGVARLAHPYLTDPLCFHRWYSSM